MTSSVEPRPDSLPNARLMPRRHGLATLSLAAALGASACAVGPDFQRPQAPSAQAFTAEPLPQTTTASGGPAGAAQALRNGAELPAQWWTLFHSDKLDALVQRALAASPDVMAAQAALRQAHENLLAQEGGFYPAFDGNGGATREKISGASFGAPGQNSIYSLFNATVNVSYTLDVWGGVRRGVEAQAAQAEYQNFQLEGTYLTLTSNVVTAAIQEASLRGQIEATQQIIEADQKQLKVVRKQLELGGVSRLDVLVEETQLANEQALLPSLQKQLLQNRDQLAVLLGQTPGEPLDAQFTLADLQLPQDLPLSLPSKLVEQRPDVRAQEALLHAASAQVGVATANMLPQITISGEYGGTTTNFTDLLHSGSNVWSIGAGVTQPIFHGGELLHKKRAAVAAYDQAAAQYRGTVLTAFRDVAQALHALQADADALQAQDAAAKAAAASLRLSRMRFSTGSISSLDLLVAQRNDLQARIAQLQAQAARYADSAALFQALGGGWWNRDAAGGDAVAQSAP